jgi:hypothetical protein
MPAAMLAACSLAACHRAETPLAEVAQDGRIPAACQVVDYGRRKLQKVQMLSNPGTGNAQHDSYFCAGPVRLSVQAGLVAEALLNRVPRLVGLVELMELAFGQTAESGKPAWFPTEAIGVRLAAISP